MKTGKNFISPAEFIHTLAGFCGTENYYEHKTTDYLNLLLTDGCNYVREAADARWLFGEILYHQPRPEIRDLDFQIWVLWDDKEDKSNAGCWALRCEDKDHNAVLVQIIIEEVKFPINEICIWVVDGVAMLPSEY